MSEPAENNAEMLDDWLQSEEGRQLASHLQAEDAEEQQGVLTSVASFELWMRSHPALRQLNVVELLSVIGPPLLHALRRLFGLG